MFVNKQPLSCSGSASKRKKGYGAVGNAFFIASPLLPPSFGLSLAHLSFQLDLFSPPFLYCINLIPPTLLLAVFLRHRLWCEGQSDREARTGRGEDCLTYINQKAEVKKLSAVVVIAERHNRTFVRVHMTSITYPFLESSSRTGLQERVCTATDYEFEDRGTIPGRGLPEQLHCLNQCFSTFVRPRHGKFFFHKTRARSQQIYS